MYRIVEIHILRYFTTKNLNGNKNTITLQAKLGGELDVIIQA